MLKEKWHTWPQISLQIGRWFTRLPFSPNFYTWLTLLLALMGFGLITQSYVLVGIALFILAGFFDVVDGGLARVTGQTSYYGAFLDGSLDRFVDFLLLFSYFWLPMTTPWFGIEKWLCLGCFFMIIPSFEVAYANHRQAVPDPEEKIIWRFLNRGEMYPLMLAVMVVSQWNSHWAGYILAFWVILAALTTLQTVLAVIRYTKRATKG